MNSTFRNLWIALLITAVLTGCRWGCSQDQSSQNQQGTYEQADPLAMVVKHRFDTSSNRLNRQVTQTLDYASIPYVTNDLTLGASTLEIPESVKLIYITTERVEQLNKSEVDKLIRFTAKGNQVVFLRPVYDDRFAYFLGMKRNTSQNIDTTAEGFSFNENVFPNYKGESYTNRATFIHGGFQGSEFVEQKKVLATASNDPNYPVIIQRDIGKGQSVYFNTMVMSDKSYRGLLFSVGLKALEGYPYRVANVSTIFLDDFPAPLYDSKLAPIDQEYDTTHANFVARIWWPDMKALADTFDIDYSAMLAFNYNAVVVPPYDFKEWEASRLWIDGKNRNASAWMAQEISDSRHELAFHGYNHFSLWKQDWDNIQFMQASLQAAKKRWTIENLGSFPVSYVPPTNNIDSVGLQAITTTMPSIKYMSSIYLGEFEEGGDREFGTEPLATELFDYPRITSGFVNNEGSNFNQNSLSLYSGIWTHFIHPDDVFQVNQRTEDDFRSRNPLGLGWKSDEDRDYGLYDVFKQRLEKTSQRYPYTRYISAREAGPIVQRWVNTRTYYQEQQASLQVTDQSIKQGVSENDEKFWFAYVADENSMPFEESLSASDIDFRKSSLWQGSLYQFKSSADTLRVPLHRTTSQENSSIVSRALNRYQQFLNQPESDLGTPGQWRDTRLQDALAALSSNPNSKSRQEEAIELAVEFDSVGVAVSILERRLMGRSSWEPEDATRLIKFYGWQDAAPQAYNFVEKLWQKHENESVLRFKDQLTAQLGFPSQAYQERWLQRAYEFNPNNESILKQLVTTAESWGNRKKYLKELIAANPRSDSLYAHAIQQSIGNAGSAQTIELLQSFPDSQHVDQQLEPYAGQIAYRYAEQNQLTRAGMWAQRSSEVPPETQLSWLLQQQRYQEFIDRSDQYLQESPQNDSLRTFVGQQLVYANFREEGFDTLYPLFERQTANDETKNLVHTEIGYMDYEKQKSFYRIYPSFFSDSLRQSITRTYRQQEGFLAGIQTSISSDNFNSQTAEIGVFTEWGNRRDITHRITFSEGLVSTNIVGGSNRDNLLHFDYRYQHNYQNPSRQLTFGAGAYFENQSLRPTVRGRYWFSKDSTYTSVQTEFSPVLTNSGLRQGINQVEGQIYREDYWLNSLVQTAISGRGRWYSDSNISYEGLVRFFYNKPIFSPKRKIRPLIDFSYADASTNYPTGQPYYTPNSLFVQGIGVDLQYQDLRYEPDFSAGLELMVKRDNRSGSFFVASGRLSAKISDYWQLSLDGYFSSSQVYRYNSLNVSFSYIFPANLR